MVPPKPPSSVPSPSALTPSIPKNEGFHRHVEIICPEGTICSATAPFSTQHSTTGAAEVVYRALMRAAAGATPEMSAAGSTLIQWSTYIGVDERNGDNKLWAYANFKRMRRRRRGQRRRRQPLHDGNGCRRRHDLHEHRNGGMALSRAREGAGDQDRFSRSRRVARRARRDNPRYRARLQRNGCLYRVLGAQQSEPRDRGRRGRHRRHDLCLRSGEARRAALLFRSRQVPAAQGLGIRGDCERRRWLWRSLRPRPRRSCCGRPRRDREHQGGAARLWRGARFRNPGSGRGGDRGAPRRAQGGTRPHSA